VLLALRNCSEKYIQKKTCSIFSSRKKKNNPALKIFTVLRCKQKAEAPAHPLRKLLDFKDNIALPEEDTTPVISERKKSFLKCPVILLTYRTP